MFRFSLNTGKVLCTMPNSEPSWEKTLEEYTAAPDKLAGYDGGLAARVLPDVRNKLETGLKNP